MPHVSQSKHCVHVEHKDNGDALGADALISSQSDRKTLEAT